MWNRVIQVSFDHTTFDGTENVTRISVTSATHVLKADFRLTSDDMHFALFLIKERTSTTVRMQQPSVQQVR